MPPKKELVIMGLVGGFAMIFSSIIAVPFANSATRNVLAFMIQSTCLFTLILALHYYRYTLIENGTWLQ